uniref:HhH-GPD domain-containing protein n=1 Tax=Oryza punctata TaxID=4537 RepID=A0A0E0JZF3_ORYPU
MMSSQTKDEVTHAAAERLSEKGLLDPDAIVRTDEATLANLIKPVSWILSEEEAKFIKEASKICLERFGGDIPDSLNELLALKGVGDEHCMEEILREFVLTLMRIAYLTVLDEFSEREQNSKLQHQSKRECLLRSGYQRMNGNLSTHYWYKSVLLSITKTICTPVRPKCDMCGINNICPSAFKESSSPNPKQKKIRSS